MSNYVTAIGLDVHARSIKACALNPMTGEVERASFGYDPASVAEWALGFESPRAVYDDTVNVFFTNRANGSAPSAQTHFHQSRKRAFAASG